ncbi:unnamed protein product, partial [Laminaria digitata]
KDKDNCKFFIQHPKKSFTVSAKTVWNKKAWMEAISSASEAVLRARMDGAPAAAAAPKARPESTRRPIPRSWVNQQAEQRSSSNTIDGSSYSYVVNKGRQLGIPPPSESRHTALLGTP